MASSVNSLSKTRLRRWLIFFFSALAIPSSLLVYRAYDQLKWEAFHRYQLLAEELAVRIDRDYARLIETEERRAFVDYNFLVVAGDPESNFIQRSSLSTFPVSSPIPGLIGYFQVDSEGAFKTPLLPDSILAASEYGIHAEELTQRQALANRLRSILNENRLISSVQHRRRDAELREEIISPKERPGTAAESPFSLNTILKTSRVDRLASKSEKAPDGYDTTRKIVDGQAAFDRLSERKASGSSKVLPSQNILGRVEDLQLDNSFETTQQPMQQQRVAPKEKAVFAKRAPRKERSALPEPEPLPVQPSTLSTAQPLNQAPLRIRTFESEIDPFEMSLLDSGQIVLFRKVWRDNQRYIQGMLLQQSDFLNGIIKTSFGNTSLAQMSELIIAYQSNLLATFSTNSAGLYHSNAEELRGELLYKTKLSAPLNDLDLIFTIQHLPPGPGGSVISWIALIFFVLLGAGFFSIYRLGLGQIKLVAQQQDFVSAVSHELKTPLTSIRMYGEMLREGWVVDEKKNDYYNYIHDESERLTRLINNVLQLARMTRNGLDVHAKSTTAGELLELIGSKIESQVDRAGFELNLHCEGDSGSRTLQLDPDYFTQIIINLVDNAIKFSTKAERKRIEITCQEQRYGKLLFKVRDYGPGVAKDQMKKIFKLFYRSENELTRETVGTGIGLALVSQLTTAMKGSIDVVNMQPGVEFRISFHAR